MSVLSFDVIGTPAPQGSKRHVGRGILIESSKAVAPWRDAVAYAARSAAVRAGWVSLDEACVVTLAFRLHRPASAPKRRTHPDRKPDLDKLVRSTLDALTTAGVIADDARVVELRAGKTYTAESTGAYVEIRPCSPLSATLGDEPSPVAVAVRTMWKTAQNETERLCSRCGVTIVPSRGGWTHVFPGADSYCGEPEPEATA